MDKEDDQICMARIWNQGYGERCNCKRHGDSDFCKKHGKRSTKSKKCDSIGCPWFGKWHGEVWECNGRIDEPPPPKFRNKACFIEKKKIYKDNENYSNKDRMIDLGQQSTFSKSEYEDQICKNVDDLMFNEFEKVIITNDLTKDSMELSIDDKTNDNKINLLNDLRQTIGYVQYWEDDDVPDTHKSKDGVVTDPHGGGEELLEFIITDKELSTIPVGTYREFIYNSDIDNLQPSYQVIYP